MKTARKKPLVVQVVVFLPPLLGGTCRCWQQLPASPLCFRARFQPMAGQVPHSNTNRTRARATIPMEYFLVLLLKCNRVFQGGQIEDARSWRNILWGFFGAFFFFSNEFRNCFLRGMNVFLNIFCVILFLNLLPF